MSGRRTLAALVAGLAALAGAGEATAQELAFIACPIYRDADAGKKSGCWLADDPATGVRYDVSLAPTKPDWNHAVLVEGRLGPDQIDRCGAAVLDGARVSVLPRPCTRAMLPAEGFTGRRFVLPPRNVRPLYAPVTPVAKPYQTRRFAIPFDFDRDFVTYQLTDYYLDQAVGYALSIGAARVEIVGYADTSKRTISGEALAEDRAVARARAEKAAAWMRLRGVPVERLKVSWKTGPAISEDAAFDGLAGPSRRRVDITIVPAAP